MAYKTKAKKSTASRGSGRNSNSGNRSYAKSRGGRSSATGSRKSGIHTVKIVVEQVQAQPTVQNSLTKPSKKAVF